MSDKWSAHVELDLDSAEIDNIELAPEPRRYAEEIWLVPDLVQLYRLFLSAYFHLIKIFANQARNVRRKITII